MSCTHSLDRTENQKAKATIADPLRDAVVAIGLEVELEQGKFTCPITGECLTWETLGRIRIDGESVTLFSVNAQVNGERR